MAIHERRVPLLGVFVYMIDTVADAKAFINQLTTLPPGEEEKQVDQCKGVFYAVTDAEGMQYRMMCVFDGLLNTAAHEAVHTAWATVTYCSIKITESNHEVMAYLAAWLTEEMVLILFPPEPVVVQWPQP